MKNFLRLILYYLRIGITVVIGLIIFSGIWMIIYPQQYIMGISTIIIFSVLLFVIIYFWYGQDYKCPYCKKLYGLKKVNKKIIDSENISVLMDTYYKNDRGDILGSQEQYIPGKRHTYRVDQICRRCGKSTYYTYKKDKASI